MERTREYQPDEKIVTTNVSNSYDQKFSILKISIINQSEISQF